MLAERTTIFEGAPGCMLQIKRSVVAEDVLTAVGLAALAGGAAWAAAALVGASPLAGGWRAA